MSFTIPDTDTYQEALQQCRNLIRDHPTRLQFDVHQTAYITPSSLSYLKIPLASPAILSKLIGLHDWTRVENFGSNSKHYFMNKIIPPHKKAKKLLIATLAAADLDMGFLFNLTNVWWPENFDDGMPAPEDTLLFPPYNFNGTIEVYKAAQKIVFAPVFTWGKL